MYGLTLVAVLAIMGGVIAYIGDRLGTKVGKRKLSIFGLRPKHTSIVITIVTGIMIAAATLGVLTGVSRDVRTALFGMKALKTELATLSRAVAAQTVELTAAREELAAKNAEYNALTVKIQETSAKLAAISQELNTVQAAYKAAQNELKEAEAEIKTLAATKQELDERVAALNAEKEKLETDIDRLNKLTASLEQNLQFMREGAVVFRAGEVLATAVVKGGRSELEAAQALGGVVISANRMLTEKLGVADKDLEILWITRSDFQEAAATIAQTQEDVIVRITAIGNTIYGEPVMGRIDLYPNRLIYPANTVVLSQVVNAGTRPQDAEEAVLLFLQKVNAEATKRGILPDPLQGTVGVMGGAELFDTVNKVEHYGGKVELTAITKEDIYTVGPLQIEIRVRDIADD